MIAIRGATTVEKDCEQQIKYAVGEMMTQIRDKNGLDADKIVCTMFTVTSDLKSCNPAKAAREAGFYSSALFCSQEPDISGALQKCIRVMVLAESDKKPVHVYLNGATVLRKDISSIINVAIDGPAGSGKSTVAKMIAKKLDILYLDTGAMYRACALKCTKCGVSVENEAQIKKIIDEIDIKVEYRGGTQTTMLDGDDVSELIRSPEISMLASTVSAYSFVREKMVSLQRQIAKAHSCVLDGRDIGTNVLPDCKFKFFVTASPEVRADRRYKELVIKGFKTSLDDVLKDIVARDKQDETRKSAPLKRAEDAVFVDTSRMTPDEVADLILKYIQEKI